MDEHDELFQSLYTHGTIYLPIAEQESAALEVCLGCSWSKCRFCDFARDTFHVNGMDRIEHDLEILAQFHPDKTRLFFLGENAFCLPSAKLLDIMGLANRYMPNISAFAMYARVDDITAKTDEELAQLAEAGLDALHVGVESGCNEVLEYMGKGITAEQTICQLHRLDHAGIGYHITIIPGLGGKSYSRFHAMHTARLIDQIHPRSVWALKLHLFPGTSLYREHQLGQFDQMTPLEVLQEEYFMLQNIKKVHTLYMDTTVLDKCTLQGNIPEEMEELLYGCYLLIRNGNNL
ncbi:MAG: radical SAM protein [Eggerthellaceae bacterium]|nr:radical SAM protein [Eggerthellaceae bacterium]